MENRIQGNLWKPCGCHLEKVGSGWAPLLALFPIPALPQPQVCSPLCLSLFHDATTMVCLAGILKHPDKLFPCLHLPWLWGMCWRTCPCFLHALESHSFPHLSYGALQLPLAREAQILHCHKLQFNISNLACADNHLLLPSPFAAPPPPPASLALSLPAHHSQLPSQALVSISLLHVLTPGESSPNKTPGTEQCSAQHSFAVTCGLRAGMLHHSRTANLCVRKWRRCSDTKVKSSQLQRFTGIGWNPFSCFY